MKTKEIDKKELEELGKLKTDDGWFPDWCFIHKATKLWEAKGLDRYKAKKRAIDTIKELGLIDPEVIGIMEWCRGLGGSDDVDDTMEKEYSKSALMQNKTFLKCLELLKQNIREDK